MFVFLLLLIAKLMASVSSDAIPMVINTWSFAEANRVAWNVLHKESGSALDAIEKGCSEAEEDLNITSVGWGGSPDETGETTLDALIFDGPSHKSGSVGDFRRVRSAISVARKVLDHTKVSLLVGDQATRFALQMGFKEESLTSNASANMWKKWKENNCQPNYWINVTPDPKKHCGPYKPIRKTFSNSNVGTASEHNHDTIGMIAIDSKGRMAVGTSTNGLRYKIAGRVGDSPIPGAGAYVDQAIGGAACTGDGDVTMRFLPSYQAVENMRNGMNATEAAENAIRRIAVKYPNSEAALVVASINGDFGAACYGFTNFPFSVCNGSLRNTTVKTISCLKPEFGANVSQK